MSAPSPASLRGRWAVLIDGVPALDPLFAPCLGVRALVVTAARTASRALPRAAVAVCRLGHPMTLRRFSAGQEITR